MADDVKDFSRKEDPPPIEFTLDGDTFQAAAVLPAGITEALITMKGADTPTRLDILARMVDAFLLPESAKLFNERCWSSERPITDEQKRDVIAWLLERWHGQRPTTPASPSSPRVPAGSVDSTG